MGWRYANSRKFYNDPWLLAQPRKGGEISQLAKVGHMTHMPVTSLTKIKNKM